MIPKGLFSQIAMIILSIGIVFTYVKPEFANIAEVQDSIAVYQAELEKVASVNDKLAELKSKMDRTSSIDQRKLLAYMPDSVDEINVMRDLDIITKTAGFESADISYEDSSKGGGSSRNSGLVESPDMPTSESFKLTVEGDYVQIKTLFALLEKNQYPLEVTMVDITKSSDGEDPSRDGLLSAEIGISTFAYKMPETTNKIEF